MGLITDELIEQVKEDLKAKRLSREDFAKLCGLGTKTIFNIFTSNDETRNVYKSTAEKFLQGIEKLKDYK